MRFFSLLLLSVFLFGMKPVGEFTPASIKLTDLEGKRLALLETEETPVVLEFWATWCLSCIQSFPRLKNLKSDLEKLGVQVRAVSIDESQERLKDFVGTRELPPDMIAHSQANILEQFGLISVPSSVVLYKGKILYRADQPLKFSEEKIRKIISDFSKTSS